MMRMKWQAGCLAVLLAAVGGADDKKSSADYDAN